MSKFVTRACLECGKDFSVQLSQTRHHPCAYCSRRCHYAHRRHDRSRHSDGQGYINSSEVLPSGRREREHRVVVASVIGRRLPDRAVVHHVNDTGSDNRPGNLVALQNQSEHVALHYRRTILRAGGRPFLDSICGQCSQVKPLTEFVGGRKGWCKPCHASYERDRRRRESSTAA